MARAGSFSPDGSHVLIVGTMMGSRMRRGTDGAPLAVLRTLLNDASAFAGPAGDHLWLGGVSGEVERWRTRSGEFRQQLPQGGVKGHLVGLSRGGRFVAVLETSERGAQFERRPLLRVWDTRQRRRLNAIPADLGMVAFAADRPLLAGIRQHELQLWDLVTGRRQAAVDVGTMGSLTLCATGQRFAFIDADAVLVRSIRRVLGRFDAGGPVWGLALSRDGRRLATANEQGQVRVWSVDDRRQLASLAAQPGSVALSADGSRLAVRAANNELRVLKVDGGQELGRITSGDIAPEQDYMPLRGAAFLPAGDELLLTGPGAPGYERVYRWRPGGRAQPTQLQVLTSQRFVIGERGVAFVFDQNDTVHLLQIERGTLLASIYATREGGWVAQSAAGAVDGPVSARGALLTFVEGLSPPRGYAWWASWDRFHAPGLVEQAAQGQLVAPPMAGVLQTVESWQAAAGKSSR
jgi:hypothetical protein